MGNEINLSSSIRTNLLALSNTNALFNRTSERLSTGLRINSALDGASPFFAARALNNRANDLTATKDGIGQAIQNVKTADKGLASLTKLVEQAKSLADQAKEASTGTIKVETATAFTSTYTTATSVSLFGIASDENFDILVGGTTTVHVSVANSNVALSTLLSDITAADSGLTAVYNTTTDKIELTGTDSLVVTFTDGTTGNNVGDLFGTSLTSGTAVTYGTTGSGSTIASLETDFEKVMTEIANLVADTGYKGTNLLKSENLTVNINENTTTYQITGADMTITGLNFTSSTVDWTVTGAVDTSIAEAKSALTTLRTTASTFSTDLSVLQTRDSFTTDMINTLQAGAGLLIDANLEEESANLLALQTRQALGTSALTFVNQSQQSVLQLFR